MFLKLVYKSESERQQKKKKLTNGKHRNSSHRTEKKKIYSSAFLYEFGQVAEKCTYCSFNVILGACYVLNIVSRTMCLHFFFLFKRECQLCQPTPHRQLCASSSQIHVVVCHYGVVISVCFCFLNKVVINPAYLYSLLFFVLDLGIRLAVWLVKVIFKPNIKEPKSYMFL